MKQHMHARAFLFKAGRSHDPMQARSEAQHASTTKTMSGAYLSESAEENTFGFWPPAQALSLRRLTAALSSPPRERGWPRSSPVAA